MAGTLSGIRVIDLTNVYSGPICGAILGDQGADVIKVEKPGGDMQRGMFRTSRNGVDGQFAMVNRNKRSIVIDLSSQEGMSLLHRFIATADVLLENFRPGVMDRLGLSYESLHERYPRLVCASINGVGTTGPYSEQRMYDAVIQGISGVATLQAPEEDGRPVMVNTLLCDKVTAMTAAQAVASALVRRERTGIGQQVQVSMLDSALFFLWPDAMNNEHFIGDDVEPVTQANHAHMVKKTADGYIATMPVQAREWAGVFHALELTDFRELARLDTPAGRQARQELPNRVNEAYGRYTTDEVCRRLEENQVPFARINARDQIVNDPQVEAMGAIVEFEHPVAGPMRQPRPPGRFSESPAEIFRCSPELGEHTEELLTELDLPPELTETLWETGVVTGPK
jgi:crotonobetainyl-CoA:carnitine CoA-transferase CaiB-like acyl-CoA transferase